jgi:polyisoprenoid-binding protein YceI
LDGILEEVDAMMHPCGRFVWMASLSLLLAACSPQERATDARHETPPVAFSGPSPLQTDALGGAYTLDRSHASLLFRVDHLGFSNYTARFKRFDAQLTFDPVQPTNSTVVVEIDARSLETDFPDPAQLDFNAMLRGEQWLNADAFPHITFRSTRVEQTGPQDLRIHGELTLRGVTQPMTLDARFNGGYAGHPMDPHARIGFSARGFLHRAAFGMTLGVPEPGSKMGVSDEVEAIVEAEFTGPRWRQAET